MSSVIHPLSGFLPSVTLFGAVIPVYFVVTALAFIAALLLLVRRADRFGLSRNRALDIALVLMISGFIGARLFHVVFEEPAYYWQSPWRVFDFWRGGFVWYGGAVTGALCSLLFLRWKRLPIGPWLDLFAPVGALGYAIGRCACLLTGCCYGRVFAVGGELYRHPTQTYAVVWELGVLATLLWVERRALGAGAALARSGAGAGASAGAGAAAGAGAGAVGAATRSGASAAAAATGAVAGATAPEQPAVARVPLAVFARRPGSLFLLWLGLHACGRIVMEAFRDDDRGPAVLGVSVSTVISLALLAVVAAIAVATRARERHGAT